MNTGQSSEEKEFERYLSAVFNQSTNDVLNTLANIPTPTSYRLRLKVIRIKNASHFDYSDIPIGEGLLQRPANDSSFLFSCIVGRKSPHLISVLKWPGLSRQKKGLFKVDFCLVLTADTERRA